MAEFEKLIIKIKAFYHKEDAGSRWVAEIPALGLSARAELRKLLPAKLCEVIGFSIGREIESVASGGMKRDGTFLLGIFNDAGIEKLLLDRRAEVSSFDGDFYEGRETDGDPDLKNDEGAV